MHIINAVVSEPQVTSKIAKDAGSPTPTFLAGGWSIVGLGEEQLKKWAGGDFSVCADGFTYLNDTLELRLAEASTIGALVYLETEYFGGDGRQAAALFRDSRLIWRKIERTEQPLGAQSPISSALRELGIEAEADCDEFDTIGLGKFRSLSVFGFD